MPKYTKPIVNAVKGTSRAVSNIGNKAMHLNMKVLGGVIGVGVIILIITAVFGSYKRTEKYDDYKQGPVLQETKRPVFGGSLLEGFSDCGAGSCPL